VAEAESPEERRNGEVYLPIIHYSFCHQSSAESEDFINLLHHFLGETLDADRAWEKHVICGEPPHIKLGSLFDLYFPGLELICDIIVELKGWSQADSFLPLEFEFEEASLVDFLDQSKS